MIRWFLSMLYGGIEAEFTSAFTIHASVMKLRHATQLIANPFSTQDAACGRVSKERVYLRRYTFDLQNAFKPAFVGRFVYRGGQVMLVGQFTMPWYVKIFMTVWYGGCLVFVFMSLSLIFQGESPWWTPFLGIGMFCLGVGFVRGAQELSADDIPWLSDLIERVLSDGGRAQDRPSPKRLVQESRQASDYFIR